MMLKQEEEGYRKTIFPSDDSFSAYIEHPVRQSTPPRLAHVHGARGTLAGVLISNESRGSTRERDSMHSSSSSDEAEEDYGDASWPTTVDNEEEHPCDDKSSVPHRSIVIPDIEVNEEDDGDVGAGSEKKKRRRTNKAEANVLASVYVTG